MEIIAYKKKIENKKSLQRIQNALEKNLGKSLPFLSEIVEHIKNSNQNSTRSLVLLQCASLFRDPDEVIFDIGTTLEFLNTATALHRNINTPENARREQRHVEKIWGSEAGVLLGDYLLSISFKILTRLGNLKILECISLATKNISHGQVLEISEPALLATPKHWYTVTKTKIAGLYGAGAKSAAYWGKSSHETASKLFSFGEHIGIAIQLKNDLDAMDDYKVIQQRLKDQELWSPLCFLIHDCMEKAEKVEIIEKFKGNFDCKEMTIDIVNLCKEYELSKKIKEEIKRELKKAKECIKNLQIDTKPIQPFTMFSNI